MMQQHDILIGRDKDDGTLIGLGGGSHVGVHAPTESGKDRDFVIPNCFYWPGSLVVFDPKGEAWEATAGHRVSMGQKVYLFEPASETGRSHRWNPFAEVQRASLSRFRRISTVSNLIFPDIDSVGGGSNDNKFWDRVGKKVFSAVGFLLAESPNERLDVDKIAEVFTRMDGHEWLAEQIEMRRRAGDPYTKRTVQRISDYVSGDDLRLRDGIRQTLSTSLQTWSDDPQLCAVTADSDFRLSDLRRKPMTVYVVVETGDIPRLKPLLRLFFDQAIALNTVGTPIFAGTKAGIGRRKDPTLTTQTLFLLNEFARFGRTDSLAHAAQYVRGNGIRMAYVLQDEHQLRAIYGEETARDIFNNLAAEIIFGVTDLKVAKELEERMGDNTVSYAAQNRPRFWPWANLAKHGISISPHRRPLMLDQEILQMPAHEQIIMGRNMKAKITHRIRWFDDPIFASLVRPPPDVPKLDISIEYDDGSIRVGPMSPACNTTSIATT